MISGNIASCSSSDQSMAAVCVKKAGGFGTSNIVESRTKLAQPRIQAQRLRLVPLSRVPRISGCGLAASQSSFQGGLPVGRGPRSSNGSRWHAVWLDNLAQVETQVSVAEAWDLWSDREGVNRWMPWIASVKVAEDKPELSTWTLKYAAFGQEFEFSWLSRNMKPVHHQKIHWRSVDGLANRGAVRFYPRSATACGVQLTISYEVPQVLAGLATAVAPFVERILQDDLDRFAKFAKSQQLQAKA